MATPESTEKYFSRLSHQNIPATAVRTLGRTDFHVSAIGFGGYRIHHNSIEHAKALRYALLNGFNLIDTSSNYTNGGSEMLIGKILDEMIQRGELQRDEVVLVSKVGYVQGKNMDVALEREARGNPFPEMVKYMENCWHCLHPDFLEDQLSRSLERLSLPAIDVYLLHNPEYFLSDCAKKGEMSLDETRDEYYRRIQVALEWMEEKICESKIQAYGISSNTFGHGEDTIEFTSLERVLEVADFVASSNYFGVVQFPANLYETEIIDEKNQGTSNATTLDLAKQAELGTLINRPLNAMTRQGMIRLASFRESDATAVRREFEVRIRELAELESQFKSSILPDLPEEISKANVTTVFSIATSLRQAMEHFKSWENWDNSRQNLIEPQSSRYINYLDEKLGGNTAWKHWSESYVKALFAFLDIISRHYENIAQQRSHGIAERLAALEEELEASETLSQKAIRVLISTSGFDCVLLGMRKIAYVEDALVALKSSAISDAENLLKKFAGE